MKLTEWYPAHIRPERKGWYQCRFFHKIPKWRFWDGHVWKMDTANDECGSSVLSNLFPKIKSCFGEYPIETHEAWRGLAKDPLKGKK